MSKAHYITGLRSVEQVLSTDPDSVKRIFAEYQTANPRVEGVMVSAPPEIAFDYKHTVPEGSEEERLVQILKQPQEWA